jgi:CheY-like chemotaxis protein
VTTILLVEDSKADELLLRRVLENAGVLHPIEVVRTAERAIERLKQPAGWLPFTNHSQLPGILLLDLVLPGHDGFEVLKWAQNKPHLKGVLKIVLTTFDSTNLVSRAYALGAHSFLVKPFTLAELRNLAQYFDEFRATVDATGSESATEITNSKSLPS